MEKRTGRSDDKRHTLKWRGEFEPVEIRAAIQMVLCEYILANRVRRKMKGGRRE